MIGSSRWAFGGCCTAVVIPMNGHLTVRDFTVTGVSLFLFAFLVSSGEIDAKARGRRLGSSPCDNERTIALRTNATRAYEGNRSRRS